MDKIQSLIPAVGQIIVGNEMLAEHFSQFAEMVAIVPSLVDRADLTNAIALNAATQNLTRVVGPSLAGVLIAVIGGLAGLLAASWIIRIL